MADQKIIEQLNTILKGKLTAINQYFLHARMLKHKGNLALADFEYKSSIDAMKHADMLVEHILSQGGAPRLQELGKLAVGSDDQDMLRNDLAISETTLAQLQDALQLAKSGRDEASSALLSRLFDSEREHIAFIRKQINPHTAKECA